MSNKQSLSSAEVGLVIAVLFASRIHVHVLFTITNLEAILQSGSGELFNSFKKLGSHELLTRILNDLVARNMIKPIGSDSYAFTQDFQRNGAHLAGNLGISQSVLITLGQSLARKSSAVAA